MYELCRQSQLLRGTVEAVKLKLWCPSVDGITGDPQPDWSLENLVSEIEKIEKLLNVSSNFPATFTKTQPREFQASQEVKKCSRGFVMHVSDYELEQTESDSEEEVGNSLVTSTRFACDEYYTSDDSGDELPPCLMNRVGLMEGALFELSHDLQFSVSEEVRNKISMLETYLAHENKNFAAAISQVEKQRECQRERDKKFDLQYRRRIAEALDNHLTALQRDHEHRSQIEERRLRDDAMREMVERKEKAQQERLWLQKSKAEEEATLQAERAAEAESIALEAERRAAEEAALKATEETKTDSTGKTLVDSGESVGQFVASGNDNCDNGVQPSGNIVIAASNALELEARRFQIYKEISEKNTTMRLSTNQDYYEIERHMARIFKTISPSSENITKRAHEFIGLINRSDCPQSISILMFAQNVVSRSAKLEVKSIIFAYSRIIILVTSKIPLAMDILLAELNRACIYTIPKHISYSGENFKIKDAYFKAIGYKDEDGTIESTDRYVKRLNSYMKLYGALVQTEEVNGLQNSHGLKEGWAWLARFLNSLPANLYTANALQSFLEMAGFALYRKYKRQFEKLLHIIARDFLGLLEEGDPELKRVILEIRHYIKLENLEKEPDGLQLNSATESSKIRISEEAV